MTIPEPDLDLGQSFPDPADLDVAYYRLIEKGQPHFMEADGAPVFLLRLSMEASRHLIKLDLSMRADLKVLDHHDFLHHIGIDRAFNGWAHWINTVTVPEHLR